MRALLSILAIAFGLLALRILQHKAFTIDEFQYAHSAWLVAHGQIPYRDFFNDRFPLLYQALGSLPSLKNARPEDIIFLRWAMLPILIAIVGFHAFLNRGRGALLGVVLLLSTSTFTTRAIEIRPDALAFALFIVAIALLSSERLDPRLAAFLAGCLVAASLWASLKAVIYGSVFLLLFKRRKILPLFVGGVGAIAALIAAYLFLSHSMADWFNWSVKWAFVHEAQYPAFPRYTTALPFLRDYWWIVAFGFIGWVKDLRSRETLLVLALPLTLLSFAIQRAPFEYSLIPFIGILTMFAARGVLMTLERWRIATIIVCAFGLSFAAFRSWQASAPIADLQLRTLRRLGTVTSPTDAVYDNSGSYFARPSAWYFFYTDEVLRRRLGNSMTTAVEAALLHSQAPAVMMDLRFNGLPPQLQAFILEHYQPYCGDVRLWGMRFGPGAEGRFWAIQGGSYFVYPSAPLIIDGNQIATPVFHLDAGAHQVMAPSAFSILWLPRDGKTYVPAAPPARSLFSFL
jgi:hypothetical protein